MVTSLQKKLLVVVIVIVIVAAIVGLYVLQYKHLDVDVDQGQSGVDFLTSQGLELRIVLRFVNDGKLDLIVPPTTFDTWADGVYAGPGKSEGVTVPAGGMATAVARVDVNIFSAPAAFAVLIDEGPDTIRLKGEAHVNVLLFTLDFPFDESFKIDV